jgi:hypothetical protein
MFHLTLKIYDKSWVGWSFYVYKLQSNYNRINKKNIHQNTNYKHLNILCKLLNQHTQSGNITGRWWCKLLMFTIYTTNLIWYNSKILIIQRSIQISASWNCMLGKITVYFHLKIRK